MTKAERFRLVTKPGSDNAWGWSGHLVDKLTGIRHPVLKHTSTGEFAFDKQAQFKAAAVKLANRLYSLPA